MPMKMFGFDRKIILSAKIVYGYGNNLGAKLVDEAGNRAAAVQLSITTCQAAAITPSTTPNGAGVSQ